jgi:SAM-dependent methyltransferase
VEISDVPLDEVARFNRERWNELADARVEYSVPALDLDLASARRLVDPQGVLGDLGAERVLCLAAGGGQQSAAFSLLGAAVTVLELSPVQLERDRFAARQYGCDVKCELGDMRDLSRFSPEHFDLVWQAHSLNFVPDARRVFAEVSRVLRAGGLYRLECTNPFIHGTWHTSWTGQGYLLASPYLDGEVCTDDPWTFVDPNGIAREVAGPREFRHTLGTLINGLVAERLQVIGLWEDTRGDRAAPPGSWEHFKTVGAPWIAILTRKGAGLSRSDGGPSEDGRGL